MLVWSISLMGSRPYQPPIQAHPALDAFNARCYDLLVNVPLPNPVTPTGVVDTTKVKPRVLPLDPTAHALWVIYHNRIEQGLAGQFDDIKDVASKAAEQAARIAGLFLVFTHGRGPTDTDAIDRDTMFSAIQVAIWLLKETQRVLRCFSKSTNDICAEELLNWLFPRSGPTSVRDILRLGPPVTRDRTSREAALGVLKSRGLVAEDKSPDGRRVLVLNPSITQVVEP